MTEEILRAKNLPKKKEKATKQINPAKNIWETLSPVDCNEHKKKKGKFDYLPWNFAWATLMEHYPEAEFRELPDQIHGDGSVTVHTEMTIDGITRPMWLAVTDFKNESIPTPGCDDISDTRMRCFTKNMAMFGLGFYIYQGEGLPKDKPKTITPEQAKEIVDLMMETETAKAAFCAHFKIDSVALMSEDKFDTAINILKAKKRQKLDGME